MNQKPTLEELLDLVPRVEASSDLRRRVFEVPARKPRARVPDWFGLFKGPRALVLALALLGLGAVSGYATIEDGAPSASESEAEAAQWQELTELALATEYSEDF